MAVDRWTEWATATVEKWPADITRAEPDFAVLEAQAQRREQRKARARDSASSRAQR